MKMLTQRTPLTTAEPFDRGFVKGHVRVDAEEENNAITTIALLHQTVKVTIFNPIGEHGLSLPECPAVGGGVTAVTLVGAGFTDFAFVDGNRPYIHRLDGYFDLTPSQIVIEYQAGFGPDASDIPHDLEQAPIDQAALHYDGRSPMEAKSLTTSRHMARIGVRYRGVQL